MTTNDERPAVRSVDDYLAQPYHFNLYQEDDAEGPYWAVEVVELKGCAGHGATPDEALACVRESMRLWIAVALQAGNPVPEPDNEDAFSGKFLIRLPKAVHRDLTRRAEKEGASLNTWATTVLAKFGT